MKFLLLPFLSAMLMTVVAQDVGRPGTSRGSVFIGCFPNEPTASTRTSETTLTACGTRCAELGNTFAYFQASTSTCGCGQGFMRPAEMQSGNNGNCPNNGWSYQRAGTTFARYGGFQCRPFTEIGLAASAYTEAASPGGPRQCQLQCAGSRFSYMWANTNSNTYRCACSNNALANLNTAYTCQPQSGVFVYEHSPEAQASQLDRRRKRTSEGQLALGLCPAGLTACRLATDIDAYECLDTASELESCGGCLFGTYGDDSSVENSTVGVECANLAGPVLGGVSCVDGACQASQCRNGYSLVQGQCV